MANTTNLNLGKLGGSEKLKTYPTTQAGNMDIIDSAFGAGFGVSGAPSVNTSINNLADGLAIVANGNTHAAITSGQYVYVRNHGSLSEGLYVATANISANGTLSGSNLTADTDGGLNSVYSSLNNKMAQFKAKNYNSATVAAFIQDFIPEAFAYISDNNLAGAVFGGTLLGMTQYCAVATKYAGGNFLSASLTVGSTTYVCTYNGNNSTLTYNELALNSNKSKISYIDINITNDTGIQVNSASGGVINLANFISGFVIDTNSMVAVFYTYSNLVYVRIKAMETMANASAGNYKVRCWYRVE